MVAAATGGGNELGNFMGNEIESARLSVFDQGFGMSLRVLSWAVYKTLIFPIDKRFI